ncbi:hypothetical protein DFJ77DRAFT_457943 [Powellomyces hirtus]|nr:hypothetical protein DFJ77DRAFT_457943 [Powellomyces hirtus]
MAPSAKAGPKRPEPLDTALTRSASSSSTIDERDSPAKCLTRALASVVDEEAMTDMLDKQEQTIETLKQTSEALEKFNDASAMKYVQSAAALTNYTVMLKEMKLDLEIVFKRIRVLKAKVAAQHPEEYRAVAKAREEEEEALDV